MNDRKSARDARRSLTVLETLEPRQLLSATLYAVDTTDTTETLVRIDTGAHTLTAVGQVVPTLPAAAEYFIGIDGMAPSSDGNLYAVAMFEGHADTQFAELITVNPSTAAEVSDLGSIAGGYHSGLLVGTTAGQFFTSTDDTGTELDVDTFTATPGSFTKVGAYAPTAGIQQKGGITTLDGSAFYASGYSSTGSTDELIRLDPTTGAGTDVGRIAQGSTHFGEVGLAFGGDGNLYGFSYDNDKFVTINPTTGAATALPSFTGYVQQSLAALTAGPGGSVTPTPSPTATVTATSGASTVQTSIVAGTKLKGTVKVTVDNATGAATTKPSALALYATTTGTIDGASVLVGSANVGKLKAGQAPTVGVKAKAIALPAGDYTLLAQVTAPDGTTSVAATGPSLSVAAATDPLSMLVVLPKPTTLTPGKTSLPLTLIVTNNGNSISTGQATIVVYLSIDGTTLSIPFKPVPNGTPFKPGKPVTLKLKFKTPASATAGTYFPVVTLERDGVTIQDATDSAVTVA